MHESEDSSKELRPTSMTPLAPPGTSLPNPVQNEAEPVSDLVRDARRAFFEHVQRRATTARETYGPTMDLAAMEKLMADTELVRNAVSLEFSAEPLQDGEFAMAQPIGFHASDGYALFVHPHFKDRPDALPLLIAYHLPTIMYGEIADAEAAELYGATLLGMDVEPYYDAVCALADELG